MAGKEPEYPPMYYSRTESSVTWVHLGKGSWYRAENLRGDDRLQFQQMQEQIKEARARRDQKEREEREEASFKQLRVEQIQRNETAKVVNLVLLFFGLLIYSFADTQTRPIAMPFFLISRSASSRCSPVSLHTS